MNKAWVGGVAAVVVVVAAWAGAGVYVGLRVERLLGGMAVNKTSIGTGAAWRVSDVRHDRGLFQSSGQLSVAYSPSCAEGSDEDEDVAVQVNYTLNHLPLPAGAARFEWTLTPDGETAELFKTLFGSVSALGGAGVLDFNGAVRSDMKLPAVAMRRTGEVLEITPSLGILRMHDRQLTLEWNTARAVVRGNGQAFDVQGIAVDLDLDDTSKGTGRGSVKVAQASTGQGSLEGLELSMEARENGDRLNMNFSPSVRKLEGGGQVFTELRMQWALNGLHTASVETLIKVVEDSCGMSALTSKERESVAQALERLLAEGFSFGMTRLAGKSDRGSLEGSLSLELVAAKGRTPSLVEQLRSEGKIEIRGAVVSREQRDAAVANGFAMVQGDSLLASYEYAHGLFKVNNRTKDAALLEAGLARADGGVRTALAALRDKPVLAADPVPAASTDQGAVVAVSPVPDVPVAVVPAPVVAPAKEVVPLSECNTLPACFRQTLSAAQKGDLDGVRRAATFIDELPRPDLGNKMVARKLNAEALESLKQDNVMGAIAQLRLARRENPQDVEVAANLGFALVRANEFALAQEVLTEALLLNPRRSATWVPLAEAMALGGQMEQAKAALWVAFQWSNSREKALAFYLDRSANEARPALALLYRHMADVARQ